ncbi:hypothetical protein NDU88_006046 [Pleurodeles waltl]|uniref:Uncharacterized protein n=1 Tax=Pleurodeles waltl TaxID=8319 RepID=A0AAV7RMR6_PLEWA|nr:hypothetical protein NDU88_006046 [Pleurodeles waltl]
MEDSDPALRMVGIGGEAPPGEEAGGAEPGGEEEGAVEVPCSETLGEEEEGSRELGPERRRRRRHQDDQQRRRRRRWRMGRGEQGESEEATQPGAPAPASPETAGFSPAEEQQPPPHEPKRLVQCSVYCVENDLSGDQSGPDPPPLMPPADPFFPGLLESGSPLYPEQGLDWLVLAYCRVCLEDRLLKPLPCCKKAVCEECLVRYLGSQVCKWCLIGSSWTRCQSPASAQINRDPYLSSTQ